MDKRLELALAKAKANTAGIAADRPSWAAPGPVQGHQATAGEMWGDVGLSTLSGGRHGLESILGAPRDLADLADRFGVKVSPEMAAGNPLLAAMAMAHEIARQSPSTADVGEFTDQAVDALPWRASQAIRKTTRHEPTTPFGQGADFLADLAGGSVGGPETLLAHGAGAAALGVGAKAGRKLLTEGAEDVPKVADNLAEAAAPQFERVYDPQEFHAAIGEAKATHKFGPAVEQKAVEDYPNTSMFMTPDRKSGFALKPDGDLVSVFSTAKGRMPLIMETANRLGASKLDAFDIGGSANPLPKQYGGYGYQETWRSPWNSDYEPPDWTPELGEPDVVGMERPLEPVQPAGPKQQVEGTWGDKTRPDVMFEGVSPHEFTPAQWGRFGKHYGAHNIGPEDEMQWYHSLQPLQSKSGQTFKVPGGLEDKTPFTYFDDLYMKAQGINPNDLTPEQHLAIHNRTVAGKQAPPGGFTDAHIFNQLGGMGMLSPNNPLTPNEFAAAATMAKGKGRQDLAEIAQAAGPDFNYAKHPMYGPTDELHSEAGRRELSNQITQRLGTQAAEKGGSGVSGNADYTNLVGLAQMLQEKPEFFRFRGAGEAAPGATDDTQWLNFVDRLQTQVPGLAGKTGSFGGVWQDPVKAATSAMDRHMLNKFRDNVFEGPEEQAEWTSGMLDKWNVPPPKKFIGPPEKPVENLDELRGKPGGTHFFNDQIFGYVNKADEGKMRLAERKGKDFVGPINRTVSPRVPQHLRPENADYVKEPTDFTSMGPPMRRGIAANKQSKEASGATGVFSDQWRVWDPIRNRFEPHEINQPGLTDVPRMSEQQHADALKAHADLGYLNYTKDEAGSLQPVKPSMFGSGELSPERARMKQWLKGIDPSKLAYFSLLLGIPLSELLADQPDETDRQRGGHAA